MVPELRHMSRKIVLVFRSSMPMMGKGGQGSDERNNRFPAIKITVIMNIWFVISAQFTLN